MTDYVLEDVMTADELAAFLGVSTLALSMWRYLPHVKIGKRRFYFKQDVAQWLARRREGVRHASDN